MVVSHVRCDVCRVEVALEVNAETGLRHDALPVGWVALRLEGVTEMPRAQAQMPVEPGPRRTVEVLGELVGGEAGAARLSEALDADQEMLRDHLRDYHERLAESDKPMVVRRSGKIDVCPGCQGDPLSIYVALMKDVDRRKADDSFGMFATRPSYRVVE